MKVLALDQASKLGYAFYNNSKLNHYNLVDFSKYKDWDERIDEIKKYIDTLTKKYKPDLIGIEDTQMQGMNKGTYGKLCGLKHLLINYCIEKNISYVVIHSKTWKSFCGVNKGKREKDKIATIEFVKNLFNIDVDSDSADAIAMGYYCVKQNFEI